MEARKLALVSTALSMLVFHQVCQGADQDLTFEVAAGDTECFWQHLTEKNQAELEYQVIDGGDLDIDFILYAPDGTVVKHDSGGTDNSITFKVEMTGEYKFCFDNSFSHMASKVVFFEIVGGDTEEDEEDDWKLDMEEVKDMVDMTMEEIKGIIDRSKNYLDRSIQLQTLLKMHEARDRNVLEANLSRVNMFSAFQILVMITVSLTQVLMIRSLFQDKGYQQAGLRQKT